MPGFRSRSSGNGLLSLPCLVLLIASMPFPGACRLFARDRGVAPRPAIRRVVAGQRALDGLSAFAEVARILAVGRIAFAALQRVVGAAVRFTIAHLGTPRSF